MNNLINASKKWEGQVVEGKFPLRQWLGGSDRSAVFLTERGASQKAAIKIISAESLTSENLGEEAQLSLWSEAVKLSHPHLLRLFEFGRCQMEAERLLYVVMEYAEEDLAQILPQRPLSPAEVAEMLPPVLEALSFLHRTGFVHGRLKPSNISAVGNQLKIPIDRVRKNGGALETRSSVYDAPEAATVLSPAADVWSLGVLLVTALTQREPEMQKFKDGQVVVPDTVPEPFREIAQRCLRADPRQRCTISDVLGQLEGQSAPATAVEVPQPKVGKNRWVIAIVAALLLLAVLLGRKLMVQRPPIPPAEPEAQAAPANVPPAQSPAPFAEKPKAAPAAATRGSVLRQVLPDVSRLARNTISGRVKINVQVSVDASGDVSQSKLVGPSTSTYFANQALAAALRWKFNPAQVDGQPIPSVWILRFQFGRTSTQVFPTETKP